MYEGAEGKTVVPAAAEVLDLDALVGGHALLAPLHQRIALAHAVQLDQVGQHVRVGVQKVHMVCVVAAVAVGDSVGDIGCRRCRCCCCCCSVDSYQPHHARLVVFSVGGCLLAVCCCLLERGAMMLERGQRRVAAVARHCGTRHRMTGSSGSC